MKSYPRIFSLSTLGLIHHQEFDYRFHEFRTDFVGESGAGKSMIADLLQLIFVGSDAFESATKATGERKPAGMVLEESGRGRTNSIGYAFLNIEVDVQKYLVIGTCIETGNRATHCFIIQQGFGYDPITPLSNPLVFADFLKDDQILPIDLLKDHILERNLFCESWLKTKKFHEILFKEKILPMDLASGDKLLKDYASILQSFSRGKTLDTQKSSSIKDFLFGCEKAVEINEKFKQAVHDMEATIGEYGNNIEEIKRVTMKQQALIDLKEKMEVREQLLFDYLSKRLAYLNQEYDLDLERLENIYGEYIYARKKTLEIQVIIDKGVEQSRSDFPILSEKLKVIENRLSKTTPEYQGILFIDKMLAELECNMSTLKGIYAKNMINISKKKILQGGLHKLSSEKVLSLFEEIMESNELDFLSDLDNRLTSTSNKLKQQQLLVKYLDINNPDSLAHWAISQKRSFSKDEESVILSFQHFPRHKPDNHHDYLPEPAALFKELSILDRDGQGFWLDLSGLRKYIKYVGEQILDVYDPEKIKLFFEQTGLSTAESIKNLFREVKALEHLKSTFLLLDNPNGVLAAYREKETIESCQNIQALNIPEEDMDKMLGYYERKEEVFADFETLSAEKAILTDDVFNAKNYKKQVDDIIIELKEFSEDLAIIRESSSIDAYSAIREYDDEFWQYKDAQPEFSTLRIDLRKISKAIQKAKEWEGKISNFNKTEAELAKAQEEFKYKYPHKKPVEQTGGRLSDPRDANNEYIKAEQAYLLAYSQIINTYISSEAHKHKDGDDFLTLSKSLLPEAFADLVSGEIDSDAIEVIRRYLTRINDKNRQLNDRKIQKIRDLLDDVDHEITEQMEVVRRIDNFLKTGHNITGGYHARLKRSFASSFPKEWMDVFKQKVEREVGFFAPEDGVVSKLSKKVGLAEMMIEAFQLCGGSKSLDIKVVKLLDPTSYYELSFSMESDSGRINKGSTGQTYAAIALLCIARLSVMSREEGKSYNKAVRVMPIDEAEGLGSNYDMLYDIAREFDYQIISLSINPVGKFNEKDQYIYMLHKNMEVDAPVNYRPIGIFCDNDIKNAI
ncbi:hypothetical protein ABIE26_003244 [Pedobacter africanus]|uniref:Uncharacterized protein n=1 Tax=Pedobacter africanus TaxID=151894 RepID=A0ACC6KZN7_9SPHI|nr:hypothetical protein [Pedobacter africanus]MDR6784598.1 hypothetical protein [Pedobacter africanus]